MFLSSCFKSTPCRLRSPDFKSQKAENKEQIFFGSCGNRVFLKGWIWGIRAVSGADSRGGMRRWDMWTGVFGVALADCFHLPRGNFQFRFMISLLQN
ncbi:hypothetical protein SBA4_2290005 [Candidatus Sulfopaludibacter sp. SbA4]|nr:hypothetical protein SBA4_2290005 [Candidatus Sulfopaludibacter sp. SbA4]